MILHREPELQTMDSVTFDPSSNGSTITYPGGHSSEVPRHQLPEMAPSYAYRTPKYSTRSTWCA